MKQKSYLLTQDDLQMLAEREDVDVDWFLGGVTSAGKKDQVALALDTIEHFFKRPMMYTGSRESENLIWCFIHLIGNLSHAARGFNFITFCCYREKMGARGPHKLADGKSYEEIIIALREVYDRYLPWFWDHLYFFNFETEYTEDNDVDNLHCRDIDRLEKFILGEARKYSCLTDINAENILYEGPYWVGGKPPKKVRVYVMKKEPTAAPVTCRTFS